MVKPLQISGDRAAQEFVINPYSAKVENMVSS
jgi:hypothetical protein